MVFIPNALFSELLKSCSELWGLGKGYISWNEHGTKLAKILAKKTGTPITVEDVRIKLKNVNTYLKRLDNSQTTRDIDDIQRYDEGPTTSAEAAQWRKARRLEPTVNPHEEADIKVHQIIRGQPILNIQTEECITEDPLENTIKRAEPELEIFLSCSNSSGSESDSVPRSQSTSVPQSQNEPASPICSKETETEDYRKQILNEFRKCNQQIHNEIARNEDFRRKMLELEENSCNQCIGNIVTI
uniref:Uncharacterized protein n=1 Tax=Glossina morsitans morsitans TaxID=37546 RepID=A0A1B0FPX1_GLOMM